MGKTKTLNLNQKEIILKEYVENKRGQQYCAKKANCSIYMVKAFLKEQGIPIRNFSEAAILTNKRRSFKVNHNYFKEQNSNMAWLLGFLASDGCISKTRNQIIINLSRTDREILERIKEEIQSERKICDYENKDGFLCSSFAWTSEECIKDLKKYSIVPNKTNILKPPYELKDDFLLDYIRGYFDGDGTVCFIQNNKSLRFSIGGASKEVISFIEDVLVKNGIHRVSIQEQIYKNSSQKFYYFQHSTKDTKKIFYLLYGNNPQLFLKRKKDKYEKLINDIKIHETPIL